MELLASTLVCTTLSYTTFSLECVRREASGSSAWAIRNTCGDMIHSSRVIYARRVEGRILDSFGAEPVENPLGGVGVTGGLPLNVGEANAATYISNVSLGFCAMVNRFMVGVGEEVGMPKIIRE